MMPIVSTAMSFMRMKKFYVNAEEMVFDDESTFRDGIYGLYKKRGLDPDRLTRSMLQEFEQNEGGKWLDEYKYVTEGKARELYPSTKGEAPTAAEVRSYTRDLDHDGWTIDDFV